MEWRQVVEAVVPRAVETAWDGTRAAINMDESHSNFQEKVKTLCAVRDDLKDRTTKYKSTMKRTMDDWFQRVNKAEKHAQKLETCFAAIKDTSAWNPIFSGSRIKLSRKMTSMCSEIDQLVGEKNELWDTLVQKLAARVLRMTTSDISYIPSQQEVLNKMLQCLPDEDYRAIRLLGMSGAGKTTILKNLNNHETVAQMFEIIIWVTVSSEENHRENLSIEMLQHVITERLIIDLEGTTDAESVSRKIKEELEGVKFLLLLDDVKAEPELDKIGIPEGAKGSKIVITTKFRDVKLPLCYNTEVKKLSSLDSWNMFHKLLALPNDVTEKPQLDRIARKALEICDGHPLMIKMAARVFKAIEKRERGEISWSDGLQMFRRWPEKKENNIMKNMVKFCCDNLDHEQRPCFLYSALHPEDTEISMEGLLECWAAENFLKVKGGDDEKIVGRNILSHLKNVILLEEGETRRFVRMHKVIRAIALNILSEDMKDGCLVRTSEAIQKPNVPKRQCVDLWTDKIWISLANNSIDISPEHAPHSSQLTTLFVQKYKMHKHKLIPDSFFQHMHNLLVLNLYKTEITKLPSSIDKLSNLKVLYLNGCNVLKELPSLIGKLSSLEVLDIRRSGVCELPHQVEGLRRLRRLLVSFPISTQANYDAIFNLSGLEELIIDVDSEVSRCSEIIENLVEKFSTQPSMLTFKVCLLDEVIDVIQVVDDTVRIYMPTEDHLSSFLEQRKLDLEKHYFQVFIGCFISQDVKLDDFHRYDRYVKYYNGRGQNDVFNIVLAVKVQAFELINHNDIEHIPKIESMDHVQSCLIESCPNMRAIVGGDGTLNTNSRPLLQNMERLNVNNMQKLQSIWEGQVPLGSLSQLKTLVLHECPMLTVVFSSNIFTQLQELQHLEIQDCSRVKEIVTCSQDVIRPHLFFPKLTTLILCRMGSLRKIGFRLVWTCLETIKIFDCPTLKEFPFPFNNDSSVTTLTNVEIERNWWEALRWPDPEVKEQLESYFFRRFGVYQQVLAFTRPGNSIHSMDNSTFNIEANAHDSNSNGNSTSVNQHSLNVPCNDQEKDSSGAIPATDSIPSTVYESPNGSRYWTPFVDPEFKPYKNQRFRSLDEAISFYEQYAQRAGFCTRLGTTKTKGGVCVLRWILCSKANKPKSKDDALIGCSPDTPARRTNLKVTDCKALLKVHRIPHSTDYEVYEFGEIHNHGMVSNENMDLTRKRRKLDYTTQEFISNCRLANVGPTKAHRLHVVLKGGHHNVHGTIVDYKNFGRDIRDFIGNNDAQMVVDKFTDRAKHLHNYTFNHRVVGTELISLFWADNVSKLNYKSFGDVLAFDATYHTNMYDMIFVPFTVVDHHKKCSIVGAGLLHNETVESYTWLLQMFLSAHEVQPRLVLTDQDAAMKQAVLQVFDKSIHRLCMWHITNKLPLKISGHLLSNSNIRKQFHKLVWNVYIESSTFERKWSSLIEEYKLEKNSWLSDMFAIREQWVPAFFRDIPMCCLMRTTSRCESTNHLFKVDSSAHNTLVQFMLCFDTTMDGVRFKQRVLDFETSTTNPEFKTSLPIERHANEVYTRTIFFEIQKELMKSLTFCYIVNRVIEDDLHTYTIAHQDHNTTIINEFKVSLNVKDMTTHCVCMGYTRIGYLCRHVFCVYRHHNIKKIPSLYLNRRWCRDAIPIEVHSMINRYCADQSKESLIRSRILDNIHMCLDHIRCNTTQLEALDTHVQDLRNKICEDLSTTPMHNNKVDVIQQLIGQSKPTEVSCTAPTGIRNKGCGKHKRTIGPGEKAAKKFKKPKRKCNFCGKMVRGHDKRNCPDKTGIPIPEPSSDEDASEGDDEELNSDTDDDQEHNSFS